MDTLEKILDHKIIAIVRGADPADVIHIARSLYEGGIRLLEITMNSVNPLQVIEQVAVTFGNTMVIGAGTVLDSVMARDAIAAGAAFILSPIVDSKTIETAKSLGAVCIPGAFTPTEIVHAYRSGGDIIKVFPARLGPSYIKDILGPLPHIPLLPTGGINLGNIKEFQQAGAVGFGIGSSLVDTSKNITDDYLKKITEKASHFVEAVVYS